MLTSWPLNSKTAMSFGPAYRWNAAKIVDGGVMASVSPTENSAGAVARYPDRAARLAHPRGDRPRDPLGVGEPDPVVVDRDVDLRVGRADGDHGGSGPGVTAHVRGRLTHDL